MKIKATDVKELREKTGAGMMDCKRALVECSGDFEQAIDWLRTKGLAAAAKKSGRAAADGLVGLIADGNQAALVELNSETDFVSRNDQFQALIGQILNVALAQHGDLKKILSSQYPTSSKTVEEEIISHIAIIGENMNLRRAVYHKAENGVVSSYLHNAVASGLGKIGVLVTLESAGDKEKLLEVGKKVAMHIAAARPESLSVDQLDARLVEREKDILTEQAKASGKPDAVIAKMVEGRISKFYGEVVLLEQEFVMDNKLKVREFIASQESYVGAPIALTSFTRFELGEGVEVEEKNFADEVASIVKK
jgi:elongation factor Ts